MKKKKKKRLNHVLFKYSFQGSHTSPSLSLLQKLLHLDRCISGRIITRPTICQAWISCINHTYTLLHRCIGVEPSERCVALRLGPYHVDDHELSEQVGKILFNVIFF